MKAKLCKTTAKLGAIRANGAKACFSPKDRLDEAGKPVTSGRTALKSEGFPMAARPPRKVEIQKKKARRAIPRDKVTRIQGNTAAARKRLKKQAGKARAAKA